MVLGRGPGRWGLGDALRIRLLLAAAFSALFAALAAAGSNWAGAGFEGSVRIGAGALMVGTGYFVLGPARQILRLDPRRQAAFNLQLRRFLVVIGYSSVCAQAVAVTGYAGQVAPWLFLYGLFYCLGYAALGFVRLMFIRSSLD